MTKRSKQKELEGEAFFSINFVSPFHRIMCAAQNNPRNMRFVDRDELCSNTAGVVLKGEHLCETHAKKRIFEALRTHRRVVIERPGL